MPRFFTPSIVQWIVALWPPVYGWSLARMVFCVLRAEKPRNQDVGRNSSDEIVLLIHCFTVLKMFLCSVLFKGMIKSHQPVWFFISGGSVSFQANFQLLVLSGAILRPWVLLQRFLSAQFWKGLALLSYSAYVPWLDGPAGCWMSLKLHARQRVMLIRLPTDVFWMFDFWNMLKLF